MARVQYGGGVTDLRGSISGNTFQTNRSGTILRARSGTGKAGTPKQMVSRQITVLYNKLWQELDLTDQMDWNTFADAHTRTTPFGDTRTLSGANWHESINFNFNQFSLPYASTPPAYVLPPTVEPYTVSLNASSLVLTWASPWSPASSGIIIWTTPPVTRVSTSLRGQFRWTAISVDAPFDSLDIATAWETAHGIPYEATIQNGKFKIGVMVQTLELTSGIASTGNIVVAAGDHPLCGISCMAIGSTFVVS